MRKVLMLVFIFSLFSCKNAIRDEVQKNPASFKSLRDYGKDKNDALLSEAQKIEPQTDIAEIRKALDQQNKELNTIVQMTRDNSRTSYLLGLKYKEAQMYADAVESFKAAIARDTMNSQLYYEAGISQAQVALSLVNEGAVISTRDEALKYLEKAVQLDQKNFDALFALSTMYAYFYQRFSEADQLMSRYEQIVKPSVESLFLQGYIAAGLGDNQRAASYYSRIAQLTKDKDILSKAQRNRDALLSKVR